MRLRVLLLADGMESGGVETHLETLAAGLRARGHTMGLLSRGGKIADRMAKNGVFCRELPAIGHHPAALLAAGRILNAEIAEKNYRILHAHTRKTALLISGICNPYMQKTAKRTAKIVTAHAKFAAGGFLGKISRWGDATIAVSEDLRRHLVCGFGLPAERITVVSNGIDETLFCPAGEPAGANEILFVSRMERDCVLGADLLAAMAGELDRRTGAEGLLPLRITLAGRGGELARFAALAEKTNRAAGRVLLRVVFPADREELIRLYRGAGVFVGVSRAAMEAAACGCAVLLCGNEGYGGILTPNRLDLAAGNFCCRGEPLPTEKRLADDLFALLQNPQKTARTAALTSAWVRRDFSAGEMCRQTEEVYRRALFAKL